MARFEINLAANVRAYCSFDIEADNMDDAQQKAEALVAQLNDDKWPEEVPPFVPDYSTLGEFEIISMAEE